MRYSDVNGDRLFDLRMALKAWLTRAAVAAAVTVAATTLLRAALPTPDQLPRERDSLAGQLLIAAPWMGDPRFAHSVVLVLRHDPNGALGLVINHPLGEEPLARLLEILGHKDAGEKDNVPVRIFVGGPVQPDAGFVIHSTEYHRARTLDVDRNVAVTSGSDLIEILHDIGDNKGPQKSLIAFGYAGWGAGQLDYELSNNVWTTAPEDPALVFDEDRAKLWELAQSRRT